MLPRRFNTRLLLATVAALSAACDVDDPAVVAVPTSRPVLNAATLPVDSIFDDPMSLAIARQLPSFAGLYFDEQGELVIALTDVARLADAERIVRPHLGSHQNARGITTSGNARFVARPAQYSFLELARYRTVLRGQVFSIPSVVFLDVKEPENRIIIGVTNLGAEAGVRTMLTTLGIPQATVRVVQTLRPSTSAHTLRDAMGNIQGAWEIVSGAGTCTLGFAARRDADWSPVWVTNSHCTVTPHGFDGGAFTQAGTHIGNEILDPTTHPCGAFFSDPCRNADAALISAAVPINFGTIARTTASSGCESCTMPLTIDHSNPTLQITGRYNSVVENETLHKIGRTTGWTYGNVEDKCADYELTDGWVRQCSDRVDYSSDRGDSGSPVFSLKANGTVELRGVHFGYAPCPFCDGLMSNLGQIENDLGPLVVFDPGPPSVSIVGPTQVSEGAVCYWSTQIQGGFSPFTYQWSGLFSGTTPTIGGEVNSAGSLQVLITDRIGRQNFTAINVTLLPPGQFNC